MEKLCQAPLRRLLTPLREVALIAGVALDGDSPNAGEVVVVGWATLSTVMFIFIGGRSVFMLCSEITQTYHQWNNLRSAPHSLPLKTRSMTLQLLPSWGKSQGYLSRN